MAIADHDKVAGAGDCVYYNPFSNALQYAQQPGAAFENEANPAYAPGLENSPELLAWINEEVNLDNTATLGVVDAILTGTWIEGRRQLRHRLPVPALRRIRLPQRAGQPRQQPPVRCWAAKTAWRRRGRLRSRLATIHTRMPKRYTASSANCP